MHLAVVIYYTIISGFKNSPNGLFLLLKYAFCSYYRGIGYHYLKNSDLARTCLILCIYMFEHTKQQK